MQTYKNLYPKIYAFENLLCAAKKAQKGKRFQDNVGRFNVNLENELIQFRYELQNKIYLPGAYRTFIIFEPKKRTISAAPYRDRVVHHALCNIIEPLFEKKFIFDSYANRKGKGTHKAILRYQQFCRKNIYALKCDIRKYFPSIDHEILKSEIRRTIGCRNMLWLIDTIIDGSNAQEPVIEYFTGDDLFAPFERRRGLPIGNLTSQFFANVYLNPLDHFIKEYLCIRCYVRYVDDFVLLGNDKSQLWELKNEIEAFLESLRLRLHPNKCQIHRTDRGVTFLGFRVFPEFRLIPRSNIVRVRRRLRKLQEKYGSGEFELADVQRAVHGWIGHAGFADSYRLRERLFAAHPFQRNRSGAVQKAITQSFP
ncbi:MAG: reverse transcriptase domain-containing protein [bacterium]